MVQRIYRLINDHDQVFKSNKFNGFYPSEESAVRAKRLARGYYMKDQNWRVQSAEVEWSDVDRSGECVSVRPELPVDGDGERAVCDCV